MSYDYPSIVAVKLIVQHGDRFLLLREPETNDWMPGRMGFPGGKLLLHESIEEGIKRKIETEVGCIVKIKRLLKVVNILMPDKNVYHFVFLAEHVSGEIDTTKTESNDIGWYTAAQWRSASYSYLVLCHDWDCLKRSL